MIRKISVLLALIFVLSIGQSAFAQNDNMSENSNMRRSESGENQGQRKRHGMRRRRHQARKHARRHDDSMGRDNMNRNENR